MNRWMLVSAAVLTLLCGGLARAQDLPEGTLKPEEVQEEAPLYPTTVPVPTISDPSDLAWLHEIYTNLIAGERMPFYFREARMLIEKYKLNQPPEGWEGRWRALSGYMTGLEYEDLRTREAYADDLAAERDIVLNTLLFALNPVVAFDKPSDNGTAIVVMWPPVANAKGYTIRRKDLGRAGHGGDHDHPWETVGTLDSGNVLSFTNGDEVFPGHDYQYQLIVERTDEKKVLVGQTLSVTAKGDWFVYRRRWLLAVVLIISAAVLYYIWLARRGVDLKIRKIAGLEAVDEAVGRATEMGRPILFVPGIQDMNEIQTVAGLIVLGRVAKVAAEHDALLEVPTSRSLVMTAARETVATSYLNAGRPDAFDEKRIYYTTDEQFAYVATVTGTMVREKPAACFYMGSFFAESLILAETGNLIGSIQIAGTAQPSQLPFFVAACDYTLIGEEFFAASSYLSGEPQQLGSLKGQDVGKAVAMALIIAGCVLFTIVNAASARFTWAGYALDYLTREILNTTV